MTISGQFDAPGQVSLQLVVEPRAFVTLTFDNTGGNPWRVDLEQMVGAGGAVHWLASYVDDTTGTTWQNDTNQRIIVRLHCVTVDNDPDSDTVDYTMDSGLVAAVSDTEVVEIVCTGPAKVGTTAGWVVGAGDNIGKMATLPLNITAGTLVISAPPLKQGDRIIGVYLTGSVQGTTAKHTTVAVDLRSLTAATAGATDASVEDLGTPVDVVANTLLSIANTQVGPIDETVVAGVSYYVLVTATTANDAACTAEIQAVVFQVIPS